MRRSAAFAVLLSVLSAHPAAAMQFDRIAFGNNKVGISATGPIVAGDLDRLKAAVKALHQGDSLLGIVLDSPGGNILEAENLAGAIAYVGLTTIVFSNSKCASACFLVFAAGKQKVAGVNALIGVHSVSEAGQENIGTLGATTLLARDAAGYGVPPAIIGKMVGTAPGRMEWLLPDDLRGMGVQLLPAEAANTPLTDPSTPRAPQTAAIVPPAGPSEPSPDTSQAFQAGRRDRQAWEAWFEGQVGEIRAGADYWASNRTAPRPGGCSLPEWQGLTDRAIGCLAAQRMLGPSDVRRRREPDYRSGWNSL